MVVFLHPGISGILRAELVIIDDIGLMTVVTDAAEGLYPVLEAAYKKCCGAIGSSPPGRLRRTQPKPSPPSTAPPLLRGSFTTTTSARPTAIASASARPLPEKN